VYIGLALAIHIVSLSFVCHPTFALD
jgi:hypothetical protein